MRFDYEEREAIAATAQSDQTPHRVLLWHWGRAGAGAKFTFELARALDGIPAIHTAISASRGSQLEEMASALPGVSLHPVTTFQGDKATLVGRLRAALGLLRLPLIARDFARSLRATKADIALCTMQSVWDAATLPILRRHARRFVLILHDARMHPGENQFYRDAVLARQVAAADGLIVLSDHVGRMAHECHGFPQERIWMVPHGAFTFGSGEAAPRRLQPDKPVRLLFFGRIVAYKGLGHLLDAYRILRAQGVRVELEIAGSGDLGPYRAAMAGLEGLHVRNGWIGDEGIPEILDRADIMVLPYVEASQSGVAAAAVAAGLPMVATPVGGLAEQVIDGVTGTVAAGMSAQDLADAIARLVREPALYHACSEGGLRQATGELSWEAVAGRVANVLREVAAMPPRRGSR
jgi:glycosyltransferase involved in cell wall biosynthesis